MRSSSGRDVQSSEQSIGTISHLCGLTTSESASSTPSCDARSSSQIHDEPAYAASTCSHAPAACARLGELAHGIDRRERRRARPSRRRRRRRRARARRCACASSSSAATLRSSMPSMRAAFSTDECACSEQTTTLRPVTWRAAISAASVDVDAVSSMCPCQPSGQAEQLPHPVDGPQLELRRRGRGAPEDRDLVQRRREQLGEDPRLRRGRREVREEARVLPVRQRGDDQLVEVAQHVRERLALLRRRERQLRGELARLHLREHRQLADALEIARRPVDRRVHRRSRKSNRHGRFRRSFSSCFHVRVFDDVVLRQPAAPRLADAELDVVLRARSGARRS